MNKKALAVILTLAALVSLVAACAAPDPTPTPTPTPTPSPTPQPQDPAPETITWKYTDPWPAGNPSSQVSYRFAEEVKAASGGRLIIETFPGGAVAPAGQELEAVRDGILQCAIAWPGYHMGLTPIAGLLGSMVGGPSVNQSYIWFHGFGGNEYVRRVYEPFGVLALNLFHSSAEHIWAHSKSELRTVDDLVGLKMRVGGTAGPILTRLGTTTVVISAGETYEGLSRGVIDAVEFGAPATDWHLGLHEVTQYTYMGINRAPASNSPLTINPNAWANLPPDLQAVVVNVVDASPQRFHAFDTALQEEYMEKFRAYGQIIAPIPEEIDIAVLAEADSYYDEIAAGDAFYAEVLESIRRAKRFSESIEIR